MSHPNSKLELLEEEFPYHHFPELELYTSPMNWIRSSKKFQVKEDKDKTEVVILRKCQNSSSCNCTYEHDNENEIFTANDTEGVSNGSETRLKNLKIHSLDRVMIPTCKAFLLSLKSRFDVARQLLRTAFEDLRTIRERAFLEPEHSMALGDVLRGTALYVKTLGDRHLEGDEDQKKVLEDVWKLDELIADADAYCTEPGTEISSKSKAVIEYVKYAFLLFMDKNDESKLQDPYVDGILAFKNIRELDPGYYLWHLKLNRQCVLSRVGPRNEQKKNVPSQTEVNAILEAYNLSPEEPFVLLGYISSLCIVMENIGWKKPIRFGRWAFGSVGETVACIKDLLRKLEDGWGDMYGVNLELAVMYQSVLPRRERNSEKSKGFLERCLKARPYSPRANFKMGEYWIFQRGNIPEAIKHLELAVSHAPLNAKARMDLIKALLAYPVENREKILKLIDDAVSSHVLYPWRLGTFRFLRGCVFFMGYDLEDLPDHRTRAAAEWIKSVETCPDLFRNYNINSEVRRFKWAGGIISEQKIKSTIRESDLKAEEKRRFFAALDPMEGPWRELSDLRIRANGSG